MPTFTFTDRHLRLLRHAVRKGPFFPPGEGWRAVQTLQRRGYFVVLHDGSYDITTSGRAALLEAEMTRKRR